MKLLSQTHNSSSFVGRRVIGVSSVGVLAWIGSAWSFILIWSTTIRLYKPASETQSPRLFTIRHGDYAHAHTSSHAAFHVRVLSSWSKHNSFFLLLSRKTQEDAGAGFAWLPCPLVQRASCAGPHVDVYQGQGLDAGLAGPVSC